MKRVFKSVLFVVLLVGGVSFWFVSKYSVAPEMLIAVEELRPTEYADDPAQRSIHFDKYSKRSLRLIQKDPIHFDFVFESPDPHVATVAFRDVDMSLYVPTAPHWTRKDPNLEVISLVDREWNRQQVGFKPNSNHLEVVGGDGFEKGQLISAELSRNCLNAGFFEVLLYTEEEGEKALYYHGWFQFPLGHYKALFDRFNGTSYWGHWYRLEHWFDPEGTFTNVQALRTVEREQNVEVHYDPNEELILAGEQKRKARIFNAEGIRCWGDLCKEHERVDFATFVAPGRYNVNKPWGNRFEELANVKGAIHRKVICPASETPLDEIEIVFSGENGESRHLFVSGVALEKLPQLPVEEYYKGLYMPMGIGVGPFYQEYVELQNDPPYKSPYFSVLLDDEGRWINHHLVGIDGPVLHRDITDPSTLHLYLLSYERQTLVGHYLLKL